MRDKNIILIILITITIISTLPGLAAARQFTLASYNVENLFDAHYEGTEYPDYIPDSNAAGYGWTAAMAQTKAANIARVIKALEADIICLQEVESKKALDLLRGQLKKREAPYPYSAIADKTPTAVACAILSRFPIVDTTEIKTGRGLRPVLKVVITIDNRPLIIFVNHWRSKQGPESQRIQAARALRKAINALPPDTDFVLAGDFNANYNENQTFTNKPRLNNTHGQTGINHILGTIANNVMIDETIVQKSTGNACLYNLWLEQPPYRRWSHNFYGQKSSLDSLIIPPALYDNHGISYIDNSFDKFEADFLFQQGIPYRWQRSPSQADVRGKHLGRGYSDHLPIFARFATAPFKGATLTTASRPLKDETESESSSRPATPEQISRLYKLPIGQVNVRLENCVVIYTHGNSAVIKQKGGRAIFVYKAAGKLTQGDICDLTATRLNDFHGLREITELKNIVKKGSVRNMNSLLLPASDRDLSAPRLQNEVISEITGAYKNGRLYYAPQHSIRLYFNHITLNIPDNASVSITTARIGVHDTPEIIIEKPEQIQQIDPTR